MAIGGSLGTADATSEAHISHTETETVKDAVESDVNEFKRDAEDAYNNLIEKGLGR